MDLKKKILYIQYTNPSCYPPLEYGSCLLARKGYKVVFLGVGSFGASDNFEMAKYPNIRIKKMPYCGRGWIQKIHYVTYLLWALIWVICWRPRVVYASDCLSSLIAVAIKILTKCKIIYHEHDAPDNYSKDNEQETVFMKVVLRARKLTATWAEACVVPNQQRASMLKNNTKNSITVINVWNCTAVNEATKPHRVRENDKIWVVYQGSLDPSRFPLTVLKAFKKLPDNICLRIIGYEVQGYKGFAKIIMKEAQKLCIENKIDIISDLFMTRKHVFNECRRADIGLSFVIGDVNDINLQTLAKASNKTFEYLACGLPVLVSDTPEWKKMYVDPGYGLACNPNNPEDIAASLKWLMDHPKDMREMGEKGRQRVLADWNYEKQFAPVIELINNINSIG